MQISANPIKSQSFSLVQTLALSIEKCPWSVELPGTWLTQVNYFVELRVHCTNWMKMKDTDLCIPPTPRCHNFPTFFASEPPVEVTVSWSSMKKMPTNDRCYFWLFYRQEADGKLYSARFNENNNRMQRAMAIFLKNSPATNICSVKDCLQAHIPPATI